MLNITFGGAPVFDSQEARQALAGLNLMTLYLLRSSPGKEDQGLAIRSKYRRMPLTGKGSVPIPCRRNRGRAPARGRRCP